MVIEMSTRFRPLVAIVALLISTVSMAHDAVKLTVGETQAVSSALSRFSSDGYKIDRYSISIRDNGAQIEVIFVPPLKGGKDPIQAAMPSGWPEVHYFFNGTGDAFIKRLDGQA